MSVKGIIMFLGMNNTRLERKILIILDFENGSLICKVARRDQQTSAKNYSVKTLFLL